MKKLAIFFTLILTVPALTGCIATMKALRLATFNEVLLGVRDNDVNKVREAAREGVVFDDGEKAIDSSNICGERPLHLAIQNGYLDITQVLLQEGADPNLASEIPREASFCESMNNERTPAGAPPLHYAIKKNRPKFAEAVLYYGGNPNLKDGNGKTALDLASDKEGFELIVAYMQSPAHLAARNGDIGQLREIHRSSTRLSTRMPIRNTTPLEEALLQQRFDVVDYLLENGGDSEAITTTESQQAIQDYIEENGDTPLSRKLEQLGSF